MKNILLASLLLLFFVSCSDDEGTCTQQDWLGTWSLDMSSASCSDPNVSLVDNVTVTAGTTADAINFDGVEIIFDGCSASEQIFGLSMELNGNSISVNGLGCEGVYNRQ